MSKKTLTKISRDIFDHSRLQRLTSKEFPDTPCVPFLLMAHPATTPLGFTLYATNTTDKLSSVVASRNAITKDILLDCIECDGATLSALSVGIMLRKIGELNTFI
jgi:hypothetical protein